MTKKLYWVGNLRGTGVYLGHRPHEPHHLSVPMTDDGRTLNEAVLVSFRISVQELREFLWSKLAILAILLDRDDVEKVGLRGPDADGLIHVVSFE